MITSAEQRMLTGLIHAIKMNSQDLIETAEAVSEDSMSIAYKSDNPGLSSEYIAAAAAAVCGATITVIDFMGVKGYKRFDIRLDNGKYISIRQYKRYYVVRLTKPNSNLGYMELLFETYLSE